MSLLGYALDVTERRHAEQSLAASETLFRTAMLASPVGLAMTELDGCLAGTRSGCLNTRNGT